MSAHTQGFSRRRIRGATVEIRVRISDGDLYPLPGVDCRLNAETGKGEDAMQVAKRLANRVMDAVQEHYERSPLAASIRAWGKEQP